jgi:hypothetical protein
MSDITIDTHGDAALQKEAEALGLTRLAEGAAPEPVSIDDILPGEEVKIPVNSRKGSGVAYVVFKALDRPALKQWRIKSNGGGNKKRASQDKADAFLIDRCFLRTENLATRWKEKGYESEKAYFLGDEKGQLLMEYVLPRYINEEVPDSEDIKD